MGVLGVMSQMPKKSGVLVYGESRREHETNSLERQFKLGPKQVKERLVYDHVGIRKLSLVMIPLE